MPTEREFRQAVAAINSQESFDVANAMIQSQEVDINSTGPESGKSALNFALEKLFVPLMDDTRGLSKEVVYYKLKIIDELCTAGANLEALEHRDLNSLMQRVSTKATGIMRKVGAMHGAALEPKPAITIFFSRLSIAEQIFLAAYYVSNEIVNIAHRIIPLEAEHLKSMAGNQFSKISNKIMLIFENHADSGTFILLSKLKDRLLKARYITMCIEAPMDCDLSLMRKDAECVPGNGALSFISSANNRIFADNVIPIDPRRDDSKDVINHALSIFVTAFMSPSSFSSIRDKGLFLNLCQAAVARDGKVVAIMGMAHSNAVVNNLNLLGIPNTVTVPFTDAKSVHLTETSTGTFISYDPSTHNNALLFSKFGATPLRVSEDIAEESLQEFATLTLRRA